MFVYNSSNHQLLTTSRNPKSPPYAALGKALLLLGSCFTPTCSPSLPLCPGFPHCPAAAHQQNTQAASARPQPNRHISNFFFLVELTLQLSYAQVHQRHCPKHKMLLWLITKWNQNTGMAFPQNGWEQEHAQLANRTEIQENSQNPGLVGSDSSPAPYDRMAAVSAFWQRRMQLYVRTLLTPGLTRGLSFWCDLPGSGTLLLLFFLGHIAVISMYKK